MTLITLWSSDFFIAFHTIRIKNMVCSLRKSHTDCIDLDIKLSYRLYTLRWNTITLLTTKGFESNKDMQCNCIVSTIIPKNKHNLTKNFENNYHQECLIGLLALECWTSPLYQHVSIKVTSNRLCMLQGLILDKQLHWNYANNNYYRKS